MPRPTSLVSAGSVTEAGDIDRRERCETDYECIGMKTGFLMPW